ncbi:MAG: hypothetical protein O7A04_11050 [Acidobacteria bacterium]|nr:hypothetical protein [Acidobacteriota bacterium]
MTKRNRLLTTPLLALLVPVLCAAPLAAQPTAGTPAAVLRFDSGLGGCSGLSGEYVAFVVPHTGTVLLSSREFPGAEEVGSVADGGLLVDLPGFAGQRLAVSVDGGAVTRVWGMVDRLLDPEEHSGCFAFGDRDFTTVDDLKTYLHWFEREVLFQLPSNTEPPPAVDLVDRSLTLEVAVEGYEVVFLEGRQASTLGLRLHDAAGTYFFLPVLLSEEPPRALVKVFTKEGDYFAPDAPQRVSFVEVGDTDLAMVGFDPSIGLRLRLDSPVEELQDDRQP